MYFVPFLFSNLYPLIARAAFRFVPDYYPICNLNLQNLCPAFNCSRAHIRTARDTLLLTDLNLELHKFKVEDNYSSFDDENDQIRIINRETPANTTIFSLCCNDEPTNYNDLPQCNNTNINRGYSFGINSSTCDYDMGKYTNGIQQLYNMPNLHLAAIGPFTLDTEGMTHSKLNHLLDALRDQINNRPHMPVLIECPKNGELTRQLQSLISMHIKENPIIWINLDRLGAFELAEFMGTISGSSNRKARGQFNNYYFALDLDMFYAADRVLELREISWANDKDAPLVADSFINLFFHHLNRPLIDRIIIKSIKRPAGLDPRPLNYARDLATTVLAIHNALTRYHGTNYRNTLIETNNMLNTNAFNLSPKFYFLATPFLDLQVLTSKNFSNLNKSSSTKHPKNPSNDNGSMDAVHPIDSSRKIILTPAPLMSIATKTPAKTSPPLTTPPKPTTPIKQGNFLKPLMSGGSLIKPRDASTPILSIAQGGNKFIPGVWSCKLNAKEATPLDVSNFCSPLTARPKSSTSENKENKKTVSFAKQEPKKASPTPTNKPKDHKILTPKPSTSFLTKFNINSLPLSPLIKKEPGLEIKVTPGSISGSTVTSSTPLSPTSRLRIKAEPNTPSPVTTRRFTFTKKPSPPKSNTAKKETEDEINYILIDSDEEDDSLEMTSDIFEMDEFSDLIIDEEATCSALTKSTSSLKMDTN